MLWFLFSPSVHANEGRPQEDDAQECWGACHVPRARPAAPPRGPASRGVPRPASASEPQAFQLDPGSVEREAQGFRASLVLGPGARDVCGGAPQGSTSTRAAPAGPPPRRRSCSLSPPTSRPACLASCVSGLGPRRRAGVCPVPSAWELFSTHAATQGHPTAPAAGRKSRLLSVAPEPSVCLAADRPGRTSRPHPVLPARLPSPSVPARHGLRGAKICA